MQQFAPHYPSTQRTINCDNSPLWHCLGIPPGFMVGGLSHVTWHQPFLNCSVTSCHPFLKHNVDSLSKIFWHICDVLRVVKWNVDVLSHVFLTHLWCPAGCEAKCGCFATWLFFGHIYDLLLAVTQNVDVLLHEFFFFVAHLWSPAGC